MPTPFSLEAVEAILVSDGAAAMVSPLSRSPILGFLGDSVRWTADVFTQPAVMSLSIAALTIGSLLMVMSFLPMPTYEQGRFNCAYNSDVNNPTNSPGRQPGDVDGKLNLVARITGKHNCRWSPEGRTPLSYDRLGLGRELKPDDRFLTLVTTDWQTLPGGNKYIGETIVSTYVCPSDNNQGLLNVDGIDRAVHNYAASHGPTAFWADGEVARIP